MDDIKRKAALHIERVDQLRRQLAEVEEMTLNQLIGGNE